VPCTSTHPSMSLSVPSSFRMSKLSRRQISSHSEVTLARTSCGGKAASRSPHNVNHSTEQEQGSTIPVA
jgi:hypothetical protein